jgi:hypothetical protein
MRQLFSGANPISLGRGPERPRPAAFARTGKLVRTAARFDGASQDAYRRDYCARRPPPDFGNEKARGQFPGAGCIFATMNLCR